MPDCNTTLRYARLLACAALLAGCDRPTPVTPPPAPPPQVTVMTVQPQPVTLHDTLPGRVAPLRVAEIRPQVSGIIQQRLFEQGTEVRQGSPLFRINPAPFQAEVESAQAALLRARAVWEKAHQLSGRLRSLLQTQAISRQTFDDALSTEKQAAADVAQARATLARKQLDLNYATVDAPIAGRIDQTLVSEGAYVTASDSTPLARIYQVDPLYIDVRQPAGMVDRLRTQFAGDDHSDALPVRVRRADGSLYSQSGRVLFSGISVDSGTGEVLLRVAIANPQRELLPGMFVRVEVPRQRDEAALLVPQQAVVREAERAAVWLLEGQQVKRVPVTAGDVIHGHYRILHGLTAGAQVVTQGMERLRDGMKVTAVEASARRSAAAQGE